MKTTYIKLLINKSNLDITKEEQAQVINFLFDVFIQYQKETLFLYNGVIKRVKNKQSFLTMAKMTLSIEFPNIAVISFNPKSERYEWNIRIDEIYDTIITVNSFEMLCYKSNPFLEKQIIVKDDVTSTITVISNKIHIKQVERGSITDDEFNDIISDYKKHFPFFDEFLKLIVDMRFAKDKKASFLHLRVQSDWGKSFLSGLLKNLEIGFEVDYHNLINKGANDISPIQVRNSFVLLLDEFNNFSQEMKKLSHSFTFAPKFGLSETVDLYLKVLLSAEHSPSFSGGVDDQIVNRVMVFDIDDKVSQTLISRSKYVQYGNAKYMRALEYYAFTEIQKRINEYLSMKEFECYKLADDRVRETYKRFKMKNTENLNDKIRAIIVDKINEILEAPNDDLDIKSREIKSNLVKINEHEVFVKSPTKTFENIVKIETTENEFKKMKFKLVAIENILTVVEDHRKIVKKINGKVLKGLLIEVRDKNQIEVLVKDKQGYTLDTLMIDKKGILVAPNGQELF
ncbi:MAG: hypothetical protein RBR02_09635 [Desulfuromonadaceae bacterium]|nr:hypothetical protein [Desulfuromonadaceae bacterium]